MAESAERIALGRIQNVQQKQRNGEKASIIKANL